MEKKTLFLNFSTTFFGGILAGLALFLLYELKLPLEQKVAGILIFFAIGVLMVFTLADMIKDDKNKIKGGRGKRKVLKRFEKESA